MGAWGTAPWDNDAAADWFSGFFEGVDVDARIAAALETDDDYDQIRAACYLLQVLGRSYVWPGDLTALGQHLRRGIDLLGRMLDPDDDDMDFLELWDGNPEVVAAVQDQVAELRARIADEDDSPDS